MPKEQTEAVGYTYWTGPGRLCVQRHLAEVECRVFLEKEHGTSLYIEVAGPLDAALIADALNYPATIYISHVPDPIPLILSRATMTFDGHDSLLFKAARLPVWRATHTEASFGRIQLVNFAHYGPQGPNPNMFELESDGWLIRCIPTSAHSLNVHPATYSEAYQIGHQLEFSRKDRSTFRVTEARKLIEDLHIFFSFCRGQWVGITSSTLLNGNGEMVAEQWGTGKVSPWRNPSNWLDRQDGNAVSELYKPFTEKMQNSLWGDIFRDVVY